MKTRGNYTIDEENYNLNISYEYYWDDGNYGKNTDQTQRY